ncbi:Os01g0391500 [Oryza sativa Japonica Group]|uniref:Os01g0391500 protein n=1 Tax=Oryza sativa subsp. japonica TaxID=39947 RepID=C7IW68_ORYSJ|nr:Os01g0391500 [Oryza sativa Japonica Group]|eukprot:NP_001172362.1 Os01g0391500 [Oryza sativa Japonica Group]
MTSSEQLMAPETAVATVTTKLLAQELTKDVQVLPSKERDYNAYSKDYMSSIVKQSCTNTRSCFRDGDIPSKICNYPMSEPFFPHDNLLFQICISIHVAPFHSSVFLTGLFIPVLCLRII